MDQPQIIERVSLAKGNSLVADALIRDYIPYIKAETSKCLGKIISEEDDEFSIAMLAFHQAIESFSQSKGAFFSYASLLIRRRLIDYHRSEKRHSGQTSLYQETGDDGTALIDSIPANNDDFGNLHMRDATKAEIMELIAELAGFQVTLTDIADNCPKQERTLAACQRALAYAKLHPELLTELKQKKKLPLSQLVEGSGVERKTLERHRKYLLALLVIYSNGYEIIRGHLKQVFSFQRGGKEA